MLVAVFGVAAQAYGYGGGYGGHAASLAVHSQQHVKYYDTPSSGYAKPTNVLVEGQAAPVNMKFRTYSSPLNVYQQHINQKAKQIFVLLNKKNLTFITVL